MLIQKPRRHLSRVLLFLTALVIASLLLAVSALGSPNFVTNDLITVDTQEVIKGNFYASGDQVALDGTLGGNVFAAGDRVTLTGTDDQDVYLAGDRITIDGTVKGDAILAGTTVSLNGVVEGDLMAVGQTVILNGTVKDDARIAGEALLLKDQAHVVDDMIAAGFSLETLPQSSIGGTLTWASGQARLAGTINQDVVGGTGGLTLSGTVGQDMVLAVGDHQPWQPRFGPSPAIEISDVPAGLTLTDSAQIKGQLAYESTALANISDSAQVLGETIHQQVPEREPPPSRPNNIALHGLQRLLAVGLVGCGLLWFFPNWTQSLEQSIQARPVQTLGWGILTSFGVGVAGIAIAVLTLLLFIFLLITLQDLALPILGLGTLANLALLVSIGSVASLIAPVLISDLSGHWLLHQFNAPKLPNRFAPFLLGVVILVFLTTIPLLGGLLSLVIVFLGLGAFWKWGTSRWIRPRLLEP